MLRVSGMYIAGLLPEVYTYEPDSELSNHTVTYAYAQTPVLMLS